MRLAKKEQSPLRRQITSIAISLGGGFGMLAVIVAMSMWDGDSIFVAVRSVFRWRLVGSALLISTMFYMRRQQDDETARD